MGRGVAPAETARGPRGLRVDIAQDLGLSTASLAESGRPGVLPSPDGLPRWRGRSRRPTGVNSSRASPVSIRCYVRSMGRRSCVLPRSSCRPERREVHRMILLLIDRCRYLFAHPRRPGVVCLAGYCGIIAETKARVRSPSMRQNPSLAGPRNASRRLSKLVGWRRGLPVKGPAGI